MRCLNIEMLEHRYSQQKQSVQSKIVCYRLEKLILNEDQKIFKRTMKSWSW